ncbi:O-antigen ligase [Streptomyces sp. ISL-100]|uniref:O-antigen ligase family protein n=1 Tax=Streptomyces sp. ISL-100 TaxID=2819173 RepID=UPI001BE8B757|nr:O-antigen ligase family protein [Streptomyces sp. ISL-100]MBT2394545.1 O-antigen ligase family protein [Streptomyces sp. ISL-100]
MAIPTIRSGARERDALTDAAGVVILGGCAVWTLVAAAGREARPEGVLLAVLAVAGGYACGRICGSLLPVAAASAAALAALTLAVALRPDGGVPGDLPGAAAVGQSAGSTGATAGLLALASGAACCAAWAARPYLLRLALGLLALGVAVTALVLGSVAGFAAALGVLLCSLAAARVRRRAVGLAGLALATGLVVGGSWAVAEDALPDGLTVSLEGQLTVNRVLLWRDAVELAKEYPRRGAGPDRFGRLSPTAQETLDSDGKPHSAPLQQAAEQGVTGVVLLGAAYGWMLFGLWRSPVATPVVLTAAAALTAIAALAAIGTALSFTAVTAGSGVLAGLATARRLPDDGGGGAVASGSAARARSH